MWKFYQIMKGSSILIRQFCFPNPFNGFQNAEGLNWIVGIALCPFTYLIVGIYYSSRSNPPLGSFLYLVFYSVHTGLIALAGVFHFSKISIIIIVMTYIFILGGIKKLQSDKGYGYN